MKASAGKIYVSAELYFQVFDHAVVRGCGGGKQRHVLRKVRHNGTKPTVFHAEIMSPIGNTVRLVHHEKPDVHAGYRFPNVIRKQGFRRYDDQIVIPFRCGGKNIFPLVLHRTGKNRAPESHFFCGFQLIVHQNKQRTDDDRRSATLFPDQFTADKVYQTFSPTRSLHHERAPTGHRRFDRLVLSVAKTRVSPVHRTKDLFRFFVQRLFSFFHDLTSFFSFILRSANSKLCKQRKIVFVSRLLLYHVTPKNTTRNNRYKI